MCGQPLRGCRYERPFSSKHHKFWPKDHYTTALEKAFRQDPRNIVKGLCRCLHDLEHLKRPPPKPTEAQMRAFLGGKWL